MTKEKYEEKIKKKYPIGTKIKTKYTNEIKIVRSHKLRFDQGSTISYIVLDVEDGPNNLDSSSHCIYYQGEFAKILKKPVTFYVSVKLNK